MRRIGSIEGRRFYQGLLEALVQGMGAANGYLFEHGPRTGVLVHALGSRMGLGEDELADLFFSAVLCDLGMIGLVEAEWEDPVEVLPQCTRREVEVHPLRSAAAIKAVPFLGGAEVLIRHHHEWWDGSGYPDGLEGEGIPLGARILRLADTVTALGELRPQRAALSPVEIRTTVGSASGSEFDPALVALWNEMERSASLPPFQGGLYREIRTQALETLVPQHVPLSSSGVLLELFSSLIDAKDPYTGGHSRRVARLAGEVASALGLDEEVRHHISAAGFLHDLGKLTIPARILRKPGALDQLERERIRQHTREGARLLEEIPALRPFAPACRHHHERWDGQGYPDGMSGERIPLVARILAICDAYDAMTSARAYRPALAHGQAVRELAAGRGRQFSPREAEAFLSLPSPVFEALGVRYGPDRSEPLSRRTPPGWGGRAGVGNDRGR